MGASGHPARADAAPHLDWTGTERYQVVQCLGRGGMGAVYEARDRESGQILALKTLLHATPSSLYLFKQEFRALADVDHPNLVRLHELLMSGSDRVFFTMELVRGTDFVSYVHRSGRRDSHRSPDTTIPVASGSRVVEAAARAPSGRAPAGSPPHGRAKRSSPADFDRLRSSLRQLVDGTMALHAVRKLHRDIKPSNVLVTPEGRVVILDFGVATEIARIVDVEMRDDEGEAAGTATYMAPEQAFEEPTPACDWYAVGVMLYEALVGRPPFVGAVADVLTMKATVDPLPPGECVDDVPADLDALCRRLLHREPAMRPTGPEILSTLGVTVGRPEGFSGQTLARDAGLRGRRPQLRALREAFDATLEARSITMRVGGRSGMGKSALVHRFLDGLVEEGSAVVLRGRAYEREAVPYKAVDGVIDALSRYLICLRDEDLTVALPKDAWALARLFPVLRRVPVIGELAEEPVTDPQRVRRRAFLALRELFGSLAGRRPLVVFVDDVQWGDADSAALMLELTRPPFAPPLLVVMTYREEDEATSPFLRELEARWPAQAETRTLVVGPLEHEEARRLALELVSARGEAGEATADAIARESGGSPLLIEELARDAESASNVATAPSIAGGALERMVSGRLDRLPEDARRLLEMLAVSGRPVPRSAAVEATGLGEAAEDVISLLRARRFVRTALRDGREVLEIVHGRIRDAIAAHVPPSRVRQHHASIADVLDARGDSDVEALAAHLLAAGQNERAARFAERAAERAAAKLAFDRAAQLLRLTINATPRASPDGVRLRKRLAEILEWAGSAAEAGRVYLEAAEGAPAQVKLGLQRVAAEQLHASGLMDEGTEVLRGVLAAVGQWAPRSRLTAWLSFLLYRILLRVRGLGFREREVSAQDRLRLEALFTVAIGFGLVDSILALSMKPRVLFAALRAGDRFNAARAAALIGADVANDRGTETDRTRQLYALAERLSESDPIATFTLRVARAASLFLQARFKDAKAALDPIQAMTTNRRIGQQTALLYTLSALHFLGEIKDLTERYTRVLAEAEERGNRFVSVAVRTQVGAAVFLAADDPGRARRELDDAMARWGQAGFNSQLWRAAIYAADIDLYVGDAEASYERVRGLSRTLSKNFFVFVHFVRVVTASVEGRTAVASALALAGRQRRRRLAEARRHAVKLEKERRPWSDALASIVRAGIAHASGDREGALAALRAAIDGAEATDLALHEAAARHALGSLLGGDEGAALLRHSEAALTARGIAVPARYAAMLVPGFGGRRA